MIELGKILRLKEAWNRIVTERRLLWWKHTAEEWHAMRFLLQVSPMLSRERPHFLNWCERIFMVHLPALPI